jgi:hypothetical protein
MSMYRGGQRCDSCGYELDYTKPSSYMVINTTNRVTNAPQSFTLCRGRVEDDGTPSGKVITGCESKVLNTDMLNFYFTTIAIEELNMEPQS